VSIFGAACWCRRASPRASRERREGRRPLGCGWCPGGRCHYRDKPTRCPDAEHRGWSLDRRASTRRPPVEVSVALSSAGSRYSLLPSLFFCGEGGGGDWRERSTGDTGLTLAPIRATVRWWWCDGVAVGEGVLRRPGLEADGIGDRDGERERGRVLR
jgi:hypothetical protein